MCVFEEEKSDCKEQSRGGQCDKYLSKSIARLSPVFGEMNQLAGEETQCAVIILEDTPLSEDAFDILFPPQRTIMNFVVDEFLQDTRISMTQLFFMEPIFDAPMTPKEMQQLFEAADYTSHEVVKPIIAQKISWALDDPLTDEEWDYAFIARFWSEFSCEIPFGRKMDILPYLYAASDGALPVMFDGTDYKRMIKTENIEQLETVLSYYKSGAFEGLDVTHDQKGFYGHRIPILISLVNNATSNNMCRISLLVNTFCWLPVSVNTSHLKNVLQFTWISLLIR